MAFKGWPRVEMMTADGVKRGIAPLIISASRATDIPAFYGDWFVRRLQAGYVCWRNPFHAACPQYVSLSAIRAVVFWTKNSEPFENELEKLDRRNLCYYFLFTVNDYEKEGLEPGVPLLEKRIDTFRRLSNRLGRPRVIWRYDPILLSAELDVEEHLRRIRHIGEQLHGCTEKLVFSLADVESYRSVPRKLSHHGFRWRNFTLEDRETLAIGLTKICGELGLELATCAEDPGFTDLGIPANSCIDARLMMRIKPEDGLLRQFFCGESGQESSLFGLPDVLRRVKDPGQRNACRCIASKDIGGYNTCIHHCVYCYANNKPNLVERNWRNHCKDNENIF